MQWLETPPARRMPIRLTPLIDVVFILLLFFMLSSRMEPMGLLQLKTAAPGAGTPSEAMPPELHIAKHGLSWNNEPMQSEAILQQIDNDQGTRVRLSTDGSVTLSQFTRWLTRIEAAGKEPTWKREPGEDRHTQ